MKPVKQRVSHAISNKGVSIEINMRAVIKGIRNGIVYGAKIRAPHALVMTFLFKDGPCVCSSHKYFDAHCYLIIHLSCD